MANTGNTQQQINYGAAANDGQGDPLRTAFIKTDDNFDAIWNTGPVGSNITILNNTIQSNNTNGNIILRPNGVGVVQANASIVPNTSNLRDLGSAAQRFRAAYVGSGGLSVDGNVTVTGNLTAGNISYTGNVFVGDLQGSVYADDSTIMVDAVDNEMFASAATFGTATVAGNVTANYFLGNGSLLTGIASSYGNVDVQNYLASGFGPFNANTVVTNGNVVAPVIDTGAIINQFPIGIQGGEYVWQFAGNILRAPEGGTWQSTADTAFFTSPANGYITLQSTLLGNTVSELFMEHSFIRFLVDNGAPEKTWQMNLSGEFSVPGDIIPQSNGTASLGNSTNYWSNLWVANNTIYIGGVPLGIGAGNVLTVNGEAVLSNDSNSSITTTGNITADYFIGDGSQLTNLPFDASQIENGTSTVAIATANGNVTVTANSTQTWTFGTSGNLRFPDGTTYTGSEIDSPTVPTVGGTASAGETGITYLSGDLSKWAIFSESAFTVGVWTDVQVGWTVTDNNGFTDIIAGRGSFGAASFQTTVNSWPAPASGKTYVFTSPDYQLGYTNPVEITVGSDTWTFGNTSNLNLPNGGAIVLENGDGVIGKDGDDLVISWDDEELILRSVNGDVQLEAENDVEIRSGYNFGTGVYGSRWIFNNNGELQGIPQDTANSSDYNGGYIQFVGNSSGDGAGYTTLQLIPDETRVGTDQYLIVDPTAPGHIHIRAGGTQDNSFADLFLGGENSYVKVGSGSNPPITVTANTESWTFDTAGNLTFPDATVQTTAWTGILPDPTYSGSDEIGFATPAPLNLNNSAASTLLTQLNLINTGGGPGAGSAIDFWTYTSINDVPEVRLQAVDDGDYSADFAIKIKANGNGGNGNLTTTWTFDASGDLSAPGNILATGNVTAENFTGNISITGNVQGTSANVTLVAGVYDWTFDNTGNLTLPGNTFAVNYANGTQVDAVTRFEGAWTVPTGNSTQSFTVVDNNTYQMWVSGNIPNGIIAWNALVTVTNTNVPVLGQQFAWNYEGGGSPILFTSIPDQIVGTAGTISNAAPAVANTNVFSFGFNNTSGSEQTVRYGWIRIS
jgi:hypothetical protein